MNENDLKHITDQVSQDETSDDESMVSKKIVCSVDLGLVVLQVSMGLN